METIKYTPQLNITNVEILPRGTGSKFLEASLSHVAGQYIAVRWRNRVPARLAKNRVLIRFGK